MNLSGQLPERFFHACKGEDMNDATHRIGNDKAATQQQYRDFVARFERLGQIKLAESRRLSPTERYRRFLDLLYFAKSMDWRTSTAQEDAEVRRRWQVLRAAHRG
jgi:hypothetical protein